MQEVQRVIDKYGEKLVERIVKKLQAGNKVATGNLINSITYKYSYTNGQYKIQITGAPYLINVDRGRRAGAKPPPVKPLLAWIKIRRIPINMELAMRGLNYAINLGFKNKKGYFLPPSAVQKFIDKKKIKPDKEKARLGMAFAIAKNISKRSIKPFPILNEASKILATKQFQTELKQAIVKDLKVKIKLP